MLWGGLELAAKGPDLGEDSLGKQSRRKSIVQPFSIFYSLALHRGVAGGSIDLRGPPAAPQRRTGARRGAIAATDHSGWQSAGLGLGVHTRQSSPKHPGSSALLVNQDWTAPPARYPEKGEAL